MFLHESSESGPCTAIILGCENAYNLPFNLGSKLIIGRDGPVRPVVTRDLDTFLFTCMRTLLLALSGSRQEAGAGLLRTSEQSPPAPGKSCPSLRMFQNDFTRVRQRRLVNFFFFSGVTGRSVFKVIAIQKPKHTPRESPCFRRRLAKPSGGGVKTRPLASLDIKSHTT